MWGLKQAKYFLFFFLFIEHFLVKADEASAGVGVVVKGLGLL